MASLSIISTRLLAIIVARVFYRNDAKTAPQVDIVLHVILETIPATPSYIPQIKIEDKFSYLRGAVAIDALDQYIWKSDVGSLRG